MAIAADARAWIEVDLDALRANYETVRRRVGAGTGIVPMVKADAYGLGAARVVRALEPLGPWGYGVATAVEGASLRALGVDRPVLLAGPLPGGDVEVAARARLTASVSSLEGLDAWVTAARAAGEVLDFHVDVDTGMGRTGFDWRERERWAPAVVERSGEWTRWTGLFTHFHSADAPSDASGIEQWERFRQTLVQLPVPRDTLLVHAGNSAGALRWPEFAADAVRPGIFLFGGSPAPGVDGVPEPEAVVSVRARLVHVREVAPGSTVGYGATHVAEGPERWGTVAAGYADGIPRLLSNRGHVLVRGRKAPIIGRISMDLITIGLDGVPEARRGDVVTLIGSDGGARITVDEVAEQAETIGYEVLVSVGRSRLPRVERTEDTEGEKA